jgi:hypothetical protein
MGNTERVVGGREKGEGGRQEWLYRGLVGGRGRKEKGRR